MNSRIDTVEIIDDETIDLGELFHMLFKHFKLIIVYCLVWVVFLELSY